MDRIVEVAFQIWIGFVGIYLVLTITLIFGRARGKEWKLHETVLSKGQWFIVLAIFGAGIGALKIASDQFRDSSDRASVPATDQTRFSFLVTDFQGEGGRDAADLIARELQRSLGPGVQVLRVPFRMRGEGYGDVAQQRRPNQARSFVCAREYNGDVVIWGSYHQGSQLVQISTTAGGGPCPSYCGLTSSAGPRSLPLSDLSMDDSDTRSAVIGGIGLAALMPIQTDALINRGQGCAERPEVAEIYVQKIMRFLAGPPTAIPRDHMAMVYMSLGFYETRLAGSRSNAALARRAARHIEMVRSIAPDRWASMSAVYADAMAVEAALTDSEHRCREIADVLSRLQPPADEPNLVTATLEATGRAWIHLYNHTHDAADFRRAVTALEGALAVNFDMPEWNFQLRNSLARMWITRLEESGDPAHYRRAVPYVQQTASFYSSLNSQARSALSRGARYEFFFAQLALARYGGRDLIMNRIARVQADGILSTSDWSSDNYVELQRMYGSAFLAAYFKTSDPRFALESVWINTQIGRHVPRQSESGAHALFDIGMAYTALYNNGGGSLAKSRANQHFRAAADVYQTIGAEDGARISRDNARRISDGLAPTNSDLVSAIESARF
ncbi:MAG TPA: hypothetical protein VEW71_06940 [Allosphingosinicella sp.]|nr:hypothetical protein [Allosphingosinicella sp.]